MKIAVTGASGHFGGAAARLLIESGFPAEDLILITRDPKKLAGKFANGVTIRSGDFDDGAGLVEAFREVTDLLMISGTRVGFREPQHRAAIEAAKQAGVKRIVYTSFIGAVGTNPSLAVKDHIITERLLKDSGLTWTVLRDAQYAEAVIEAMAPLLLSSGQMTSLAGDGRMAFVCREDCVASAVAVLLGDGHDNRIYELTGPALVSYREVARMVAEVGGRPVAFNLTDEAGLYAIFDALGIPRQPVDDLTVNNFPWNSDDMVSFEMAVRDGDFDVISDDVQTLTGRKPTALRDLLIRHRQGVMAAADRMGNVSQTQR